MRLKAHQSGMALVLLLWFLAALALLVTGLMGLSRQEVHAVRLQQGQAQASAVGDGVARMVAQGLILRDSNSPPLQARIQMREFLVHIRIVPSTGFVDILSAEGPLLEQVFSRAAHIDQAQAQRLVSSIEQWRTADQNEGGRGRRGPSVFVLEDIMVVPGLTRDIFNKIRWFVCAGCNSRGLNLEDAPYHLQQAMDWTKAGEAETDPAAVGEPLSPGGEYRIDVRVLVADGTVMQRSIWMEQGELGRRYPAFRVSALEFERDNFGQY